MRTGERGFSYLLLLFVLAAGGALLAAAATRWQTATQRERETELLFRGAEIRRALADYAAAGGGALPLTLEALLEDRRGEAPRHHLRRLYADPFTGQADWLMLRRADGGVYGVHSRARTVALRRSELPVLMERPASPPRVGDWWFVIEDNKDNQGRPR